MIAAPSLIPEFIPVPSLEVALGLALGQEVNGLLVSSAKVPLAGQAVRVPITALADVLGLQVDGGFDGLGHAVVLRTEVERGRREERLGTRARDVVHLRGEALGEREGVVVFKTFDCAMTGLCALLTAPSRVAGLFDLHNDEDRDRLQSGAIRGHDGQDVAVGFRVVERPRVSQHSLRRDLEGLVAGLDAVVTDLAPTVPVHGLQLGDLADHLTLLDGQPDGIVLPLRGEFIRVLNLHIHANPKKVRN